MPIRQSVPQGQHRDERPFRQPLAGQLIALPIDLLVPRIYEGLTAGRDIERRSPVASDEPGRLLASDDLHQIFTQLLPPQGHAQRNAQGCTALGPDKLQRGGQADEFHKLVDAAPARLFPARGGPS